MTARAGSFGLLLLLAVALTGCGAFISPQHRIETARRDISAGKWGAAAIELRMVVQSHPDNAQAWQLLAELSVDAADLSGAQSALKHAIAAGAKGPDIDALRVRIWLAAGQPKAVVDAITHRTVQLAEPGQSVALARAYAALEQFTNATQTLQSVLAQHPDLTEARVLMAEALAGEGQYDPALQQLDVAMQGDAKSPLPPLARGRILAWRGQYAAAESSLTLALQRMPAAHPFLDRIQALIALTEAQLAQGEVGAAARSQAALMRVAPGSPIGELLGARIELARGELQQGADELQGIVAKAPGFLEAQMYLGAAELARGNLGQAQIELEQVLQRQPGNVEARKLLATAQLRLGEPQAALDDLTPVLSAQAADPQLLSLLGAAATKAGDSQSVLQTLEGNLRADPNNETLRLNLAQAYLGAGRPRDALMLLQATPDSGNLRRDSLLVAALLGARGPAAAGAQVDALLAAHPRDPAALNLGAAYFVSQNLLDRAQPLLRKALAVDPADVPAAVELARLEAAAGDLSGARGTLESALAAGSGALAVRLELADVLVRMKDFDQAAKLLAAADQPGAGPAVKLAIAQVDLARGDVKQAQAVLDQAIADQPAQPALLENAGLLLLAANQYDAALPRLVAATKLAPDDAVYWLNTARAQIALNQPQAARESLQRAAQIRPRWLPAVNMLTVLDVAAGKSPAALQRVDALLASEPHDPDALALKGYVESSLGDANAASAAYTQAQEQRPTALVAVRLYRLALASHRPQPEKPLEQWLARQPDDWRVHEVLGEYYLTVPSLRPAAREFEAALRGSPQNLAALNNLAWTYGKLDDPRSESLAEEAYRLGPQSPDVNDTLGWILVQKREWDRALTLLGQAVKLQPANPDFEYHYADALFNAGKRDEARRILTRLLSTPQPFDSRADAQRLLASMKAT